jgi:hypothetical protein
VISYTLAASAPLEGNVWRLAAMPDDGAIAALGDQQYLATIRGASPAVVKHGGLFHAGSTGVGVTRTGEIYVSLSPTPKIAVLLVADNTSRREIPCPFLTGEICVPPAGTEIYAGMVLVQGSGTTGTGIAVIDTVGKSAAEFVRFNGTPNILQIVADPNGGRLFVRSHSAVYAIDLATRGISAFTEDAAESIAVSADGSYLYVLPSGKPPKVEVVRTSTLDLVSSISISGVDDGAAIAVSADGVHLLVAGTTGAAGSSQDLVLLVTELATGRNVAVVKLNAESTRGPMVVSPDGSLIFIPTDDPATIAVVQRKVQLLFLDVKVTIGSAPAWLVSRYAVTCTYTTLTGDHACASDVFDAGGGTVTGLVSDDGGHFPATVNVAVAIDFVPASGLAGVVRTFTPAVTDVGVNFLFEPDQMMQTVELIFDLTSPPPQSGDFLSVQWQHHVDGGTAGAGTKFLSGQDLAMGPVIRTDIILMPAATPGTLAVTIQGRYNGAVLVTFSRSFDVANTAYVLRPQPAGGGSYTLAVAT